MKIKNKISHTSLFNSLSVSCHKYAAVNNELKWFILCDIYELCYDTLNKLKSFECYLVCILFMIELKCNQKYLRCDLWEKSLWCLKRLQWQSKYKIKIVLESPRRMCSNRRLNDYTTRWSKFCLHNACSI